MGLIPDKKTIYHGKIWRWDCKPVFSQTMENPYLHKDKKNNPKKNLKPNRALFIKKKGTLKK